MGELAIHFGSVVAPRTIPPPNVMKGHSIWLPLLLINNTRLSYLAWWYLLLMPWWTISGSCFYPFFVFKHLGAQNKLGKIPVKLMPALPCVKRNDQFHPHTLTQKVSCINDKFCQKDNFQKTRFKCWSKTDGTTNWRMVKSMSFTKIEFFLQIKWLNMYLTTQVCVECRNPPEIDYCPWLYLITQVYLSKVPLTPGLGSIPVICKTLPWLRSRHGGYQKIDKG